MEPDDGPLPGEAVMRGGGGSRARQATRTLRGGAAKEAQRFDAGRGCES
jgi:hypothetical protein